MQQRSLICDFALERTCCKEEIDKLLMITVDGIHFKFVQ